ncbi:hypothetical protein [Marixanthomonas ophiurae]|uniref:Uncharacterized protein n=1 Tax=Marixanthomonas ophiurae TaxID=387659 RepID=A0A3E1QCF0_9FLAO|nr:hypothetical protein [Marixanthomonas ophiurae]RFN59776.1 hypothetical protein DZ858_06915 [Marixanthomonas ophiurae]
MESNKFEENIREKLQEREIQPSNDAWEKLNARLGKPEKKKSYVLWYAVAASLVSILVIGAFFIKDDVTSASQNLVKTPTNKEKIDVEKQPEFIPQEINSEEIAAEENIKIEQKKKQQVPNKQLANQKTQLKQAVEVSSEKEEAIAKTETNLEEQSIPKGKVVDKTNGRFFENKVNEVVAQVKEIQSKNHEVTPEEINALLANAQRDIKTRQILNPETQKVDAAALLLDVELELERSFREKVFDALGDGFNKVRTAVVERNN